jgi:hypothetical protein
VEGLGKSKIQLHAHSNLSDDNASGASAAALGTLYYLESYQGLGASDHRAFTWPWTPADTDFANIPNEEVTDPSLWSGHCTSITSIISSRRSSIPNLISPFSIIPEPIANRYLFNSQLAINLIRDKQAIFNRGMRARFLGDSKRSR